MPVWRLCGQEAKLGKQAEEAIIVMDSMVGNYLVKLCVFLQVQVQVQV